jgi:hypothetical protein
MQARVSLGPSRPNDREHHLCPAKCESSNYLIGAPVHRLDHECRHMRGRFIGHSPMGALKILQPASCVLGEKASVKGCQLLMLAKSNGGQVLDDEEWFKEAYQRPRHNGVGNLGGVGTGAER